MKSFANKVAAGASGAIVFLLGCAVAGMGLAVLSVLAVFAMAVAGLALLAAPFLAMAQTEGETVEAEAETA